MKGLSFIPSDGELSRVYDRLQLASDAAAVGEIALWSQFARFDPRLAEQLIVHIVRFWRRIPPLDLNEELLKQAWPAALGVILEHGVLFDGMKSEERDFFSRWRDWVMTGVPVASNEQFLIGLRAVGGKAMVEDAVYSLSIYRKWGFFGRDVLLNKWKAGHRTLVPQEARKVALDELIGRYRRFTAREYRALLRNEVSPRQAELDLNADSRLRAEGATRGRVYVRRGT